MHAAIFSGKDHSENMHSIRNTGQKPTVQRLFDVTQTLIREQELEISEVSELSWSDSKWEKLHLKVYVLSDSVLCVGQTHEYTQLQHWMGSRLSWFKDTQQYKKFDGLDGVPDRKNPRRYASSVIARKALRGSRIFTWVGLQYGELRSNRGPGSIYGFLFIELISNSNVTTAGKSRFNTYTSISW